MNPTAMLLIHGFSPEDPKSHNVRRGKAVRPLSQPMLRNPPAGYTHHLFLVEISGSLGAWNKKALK